MRGAFAVLGLALAGCARVALPGVSAPPPKPPPSLIFDPPAELPAPEGLHATSGQYRAIPLQWDPVLRADVAGYLLESSAAREGPYAPLVALPDRGHLAWVDRGASSSPLSDGTTRFYRMRTFNRDYRVSAQSSEIVVATTAPLPAPPDELHAYSQQPRQVPLSWNPATDPAVAGYTVERSPNEDGPFEVVAELDGRHNTHLLDGGLGDLRVLYYRVSSRNTGGERGPPSPVLRAVTKPLPLPPIGLRVKEQRLGANVLRWEPNVERDLHAYRLLRVREGEEPLVVSTVTAGLTQAEDATVGAGEEVHYAVVAVDQDALESLPSEEASTQSVGYELRAEADPARVHLQWNPRRDEGYSRASITRSAWPWQRETFVNESGELLDRHVSPGRTYTYVVVLERADGRLAPPSRRLEITVPEEGSVFVEIQQPTPRIPPPDGVPR